MLIKQSAHTAENKTMHRRILTHKWPAIAG